jgi:uncharacterized membrane protein
MASHYLHKPTIGMVSGFGSGILLSIQQFVTDENILKIVAGVGIFLGAMVAFLTVILKLIEVFQKLKVLEMLQKIKNITFKNK